MYTDQIMNKINTNTINMKKTDKKTETALDKSEHREIL